MSIYDTDAFNERVNYAAQVIINNRRTSRYFDTCFEMGDGDRVVAALVRRAEHNVRLAENLSKYVVVPKGST